jgi:hypothetical protein
MDHLEQLIVDETKPDWDWKAGIKEQMEIRKQQDRIVELIKVYVFKMDDI